MTTADPEALAQMKERHREGTRWAAYENKDMWRTLCGHVQFLLVGVGCTFSEPLKSYPKDNEFGPDYPYLFVGYVDLDTGKVIPA